MQPVITNYTKTLTYNKSDFKTCQSQIRSKKFGMSTEPNISNDRRFAYLGSKKKFYTIYRGFFVVGICGLPPTQGMMP
mgnify:CR=1 FL=1